MPKIYDNIREAANKGLTHTHRSFLTKNHASELQRLGYEVHTNGRIDWKLKEDTETCPNGYR